MRALLILACALLFVPAALAQNWKQVHRADVAKWAKATGLDPSTVHRLWRQASQVTDEKEDDSRIAGLDVEGLAEHHDVMLVTYAGENNCLTITVFHQLSESQFSKVWSSEKTPDGSGFCDTEFASAQADALNGAVMVRVPRSLTNGLVNYTVYKYEWNGITYHLAGQKDVQGR